MANLGPAPKVAIMTKNGPVKLGNKKPPEVNGGDVVSAPAPPKVLSKDARAHWDKLVPILLQRQSLSDADYMLLTALCESFARCQQLHKSIADAGTSGLVMKVGKTGYLQQTPYITLLNAETDRLLKLSREFGLSPSSRSRAGITNTTEAFDDLLD